MADGIINFATSGRRAQKRLKPAVLKASLENIPDSNRHTSHEDVRMRNNASGVPSCPEQINILMADKIPIVSGNPRKSLILEEHRFLDLEELEQQAENALEQLTPKQLEFANFILKGYSYIEAYRKAGISKIKNPTPEQLSNQRGKAAKLRQQKNISCYVSASLRRTYEEAQETLRFGQLEWLATQRKLVAMAMGEEETPKVYIKDGHATPMMVKDAALGVAQKALQVIAQQAGYLVNEINVHGDLPMVLLKDYTGGSSDDKTSSDDGSQT